ncbi:MAG TPA: MASE1 domain-containing protein [Burkholderiaceae bacterium]|nr:MASE1 domain-containing protein [Burkholderiaceae bacterium]
MGQLVEASSSSAAARTASLDRPPWTALLAVAAAYYIGARVGLSLTAAPFPLAVLWPPNALLFAALLLAPSRWWWMLIAAAFPAHLAAELQENVPLVMVLCWFVSNITEALIGASFVRWLAGPGAGLNTVRMVIVFCGAAALAPFVSSFFDAAFVRLVGFGSGDYWSLWKARLPSNMLAALIFVPVVLTWAAVEPPLLRAATRARAVEGGALLAGLLVVSFVAFDTGFAHTGSASLLYLPVPFLIWAALRFGPPLTSAGFMVVAFLVIWGAGHGRGPFMHPATPVEAPPIQLFLVTIAVPLLLLAALIEERRVAEQRQRASQRLFATAFRSSPDAVAISRRRDGRVLEANNHWLELMGYRPDELARGHVAPLSMHLHDAGDRARVEALLHDVGDITRDVEVTLRDRRGNATQVLVRAKAVELDGQACTISIVRDISELRRVELQAREQRLQLTHLTRVASLTELSSTLAHELNQPLTAILSNAQAALRFLSREPAKLDEIRPILQEIVEADKRAGELIHHLRLLMKRGDEQFVRVDLNQVVRKVLELLHGEFVTRDVDVRFGLSHELPQVHGDPVQLQQVVMNLVSNACDAMRSPACRERTLSVTTLHGFDGSVQLVVSDTGPGIAVGQLDRVFEPFFTTKASGLGLGLPISRRIARAHGGTLVAEQRDRGAAFRLTMPVARVARVTASRVTSSSSDRG